MQKSNFLLVVCILTLIVNLYSQEKIRIAVLELNPAGLSKVETQILSDRLRTELFNTGKFNVIEREKMDEILKEQGFQQSGCTTNECVIEVGKLIGVDQMVAGNVGKLADLHTINIRLIDVETGKVLQTATRDCKCPITIVLTKSISEVSQILAGGTSAEQNISYSLAPKIPFPYKEELTIEDFSDEGVRYAIALFKSGQYENARKQFQKLLNENGTFLQKTESLYAILYLSETYDIMKSIFKDLDDYQSFLELINIFNKLEAENPENAIGLDDLRFRYALKLMKLNRLEYSAEILNTLVEKPIATELLVEVLNFKIRNRLGNYYNDFIRLRTNFPNHPYTLQLTKEIKDIEADLYQTCKSYFNDVETKEAIIRYKLGDMEIAKDQLYKLVKEGKTSLQRIEALYTILNLCGSYDNLGKFLGNPHQIGAFRETKRIARQIEDEEQLSKNQLNQFLFCFATVLFDWGEISKSSSLLDDLMEERIETSLKVNIQRFKEDNKL